MPVEHTEMRPHAPDGTRLFLQRWSPADTAVRAELLVVHGFGEHGGRYRELAHRLGDGGIAVSALDYRGHGRAEGRRGFVERYQDYHTDVETCLAELRAGPRFILGHSHGGIVTLDYLRAQEPALQGLIISNPQLELAMPVPAWKSWMANFCATLYPRLALPSGIDANGFSHDKAIVEAYNRDPLVTKLATAGWFREWTLASERVKSMIAVSMPLYFLYSDSDPICAPKACRALAAKLVSPDKTVEERQGELHEIFNEVDRAVLHEKLRDWILAHLD